MGFEAQTYLLGVRQRNKRPVSLRTFASIGEGLRPSAMRAPRRRVLRVRSFRTHPKKFRKLRLIRLH